MKSCCRLTAFCLLAVTVSGLRPAAAEDYNYVGKDPAHRAWWSLAKNWNPSDSTPSAAKDSATINGFTTTILFDVSSAQIAKLRLIGSGTLQGAGPVASMTLSESLSITGSSLNLSDLTLLPGASFDWNSARLSGVVTNGGSGRVTNNLYLYASPLSETIVSKFSNSGTLELFNSQVQKSGLGVTFDNSGLVRAVGGESAILLPGTHTGRFDADDGATLRLGAGPNPVDKLSFDGAYFTGAGVTSFSNALVGGPGALPGSATITGTVRNDGVLAGTGTFTATQGGTFWLATQLGDGVNRPGGPLRINVATDGNLKVGGGTIYGDAVLTNDGQGAFGNTTLTLRSYARFVNNGTLTAGPGAGGISRVTGQATSSFDNTGTVRVASGTLALTAPGTHTGQFRVDAGAALTFGYYSSAVLNANNPTATFRVYGPGVTTIGGQVDLSGVAFLYGPSVLSGTNTGSGVWTVPNGGSLKWTDGTLGSGAAGDGNVVVGAGGTLTLAAKPAGATNTLTLRANASVVNSGTILFGDGTNGSVTLSTGTGATVDNYGTARYAGTGSVVLGAGFSNKANGVVEALSGSVTLSTGSTHTDGTFDAAPGATVRAFGTYNGATTFRGAGRTEISGTANGTVAVIGTGSAIGVLSGPGTVAVRDGGVLGSVQFASLGNGTAGRGNLTIDAGGTLAVVGLVGSPSSLSLKGGAVVTNNGQVQVTAGGTLLFEGNAQLANAGTLTLGGTSRISQSTGTAASVVNTGTVLKTGAGAIDFLVPSDNRGTVEVQAGTLRFNRPVVQHVGASLTAGTWVVDDGATLELNDGSAVTRNQADVTLRGLGASFPTLHTLSDNQGTLRVFGGQFFATTGGLTNSGRLAAGAASGITVAGNYVQTSAGVLQVGIGPLASGATGNGTLHTVGSATLAGTLVVTLPASFTPAAGESFTVLTATGGRTGTFDNTPGGVLVANGGTFQVRYTPTDVILTVAPVPEPAAGLAFAAAGLGAARWARRRATRRRAAG